MAAIDIPDGYWTIYPPGFEARAMTLQAQLQAARYDVLNGARPIANGGDASLISDLALSDADEGAMRSDAAGEMNAAASAATGDVLTKYGHGDDLAGVVEADLMADAIQPTEPPGGWPTPPNPGDIPPDTRDPRIPDPPPPSGGPRDPGVPPDVPSNDPTRRRGQPTVAGGPTLDEYTAWMLECTGRPGSEYEWSTFWAMRTDWRDGIYNSGEASNYRDRMQDAARVESAGGYVTRDDLAAHLNALDATINILV
jgi:hypothetical protein